MQRQDLKIHVHGVIVLAEKMCVICLIFGFRGLQHAIDAMGQLRILGGIEELVMHLTGFRGTEDVFGSSVDENHSPVWTERYNSSGNRSQDA